MDKLELELVKAQVKRLGRELESVYSAVCMEQNGVDRIKDSYFEMKAVLDSIDSDLKTIEKEENEDEQDMDNGPGQGGPVPGGQPSD